MKEYAQRRHALFKLDWCFGLGLLPGYSVVLGGPFEFSGYPWCILAPATPAEWLFDSETPFEITRRNVAGTYH